jgi:prepilin-type N-terminal cleavage/methylation domain-containing protein
MNSKILSKNRRGFTLIELLIVIVIIIILVGVGVPLSAGFITERNVYSAATQVQQDLLLVQNIAITHSSGASGWFEIYFYPSDNKYYVETTEDAVFNSSTKTIQHEKVITRQFSSALKFPGYSDGGHIAFDNQGIPHPSGGVITISNTSESKVVTVTISPIGRVKIDWVLK